MTQVPKAGSISFAERVDKDVPFEWGFGSTPRTAMLRDDLRWKAAVVKDWVNVAMGIGKCTFRQGIKADVDRARLITKSYKETDGESWVIRRAKAVETLCEQMPIFIKKGELIVGDPNGSPDEVRWYPEICVHWMPDAVTTGGFSQMVTDEERAEIVEDICEYWKDKCMVARIKAALPKTMAQDIAGETLTEPCLCNYWEMYRALPGYDYALLFREGIKARVDKAEDQLKRLDDRVREMAPSDYVEKRNNWEAMAMCGRAMLCHIRRYADLANLLAKEEKKDVRKKELKDMAASLDWLSGNPPRTFHECLQLYWMIEVLGHFLVVGGNGCGVRIDQVWWPYYEADMKAGRITREKALELVECLFLKIQEVGAPLEWPVTFAATSGAGTFYTANICGSTPEGADASNDLSCIIMEALANLRVSQPPVAVRYHRGISPDVVERAIDLERTGMGHPSWFNEDLLEQWGLMRGWPLEDAKKTQGAGCVANHIMGTTQGLDGVVGVGNLVVPMVLDEVLFQGGQPAKPLSEGRLPRPETKDPRQMTSAEELLDAMIEWSVFYVNIAVVSWNIGRQVIEEFRPDPCNSLLLAEPLETGVDALKLGKQLDTIPYFYPMGQITAADSLAAIQKLVFDDKKYSMEELLNALKSNWQGCEEMRQDFLNAPKYGNDDDYVDNWVVCLKVRMSEAVGQVRDGWGYPVVLDGSTAAAYQVVGLGCGASPDGRHAMDLIADGSRSPSAGADKCGPTAVLNSAGKIPYMHTELFNQRFMPQFLEGENRKLFGEYLKEWYDKGTISHVQFNVVDNSTLRDAQENPSNYTDLQVRIAGYSAFWVDLPKETQDSIIARTEHSF